MKVKKDKSIVVTQKAIDIHDSFPFIVDLHSDALMRGKRLWVKNKLHVNFSKMREGNAALQIFGIATKAGIPNMDSNKEPSINTVGIVFPKMLFKNVYQKAIYQIDKLHEAELKDDKFRIVKSKQDLEELISLRKSDKDQLGGMFCIEGIHCIGDSIERLDQLYERGVRIIGLAHFFDNQYSGSQSGKEKYGLTNKGKVLLERIDSLGMIVDLAHSSLSTIDSVLKYSTKPPIVSHVGCTHVQKSTRNLSDEYLKKILNAGGLIGVMFFDPVNRRQIKVDDIVNNILHLIDLNQGKTNGIALGSDYDGMTIVPFDISDLNILTSKLLENGISRNDVERLMGLNSRDFLLEHL